MHNLLHHLLEVWFGWVRDYGYWGIIVLMAMESSITPVPSEIVIPPAAFLAAQYGHLNFYGVILAGTFGSYLGSALSYWVALLAGRPLVARFGKYFFMSESKLDGAEALLHRYEAGAIFFSRLLPGVRHLISIPSGILKVPFGMFSLMTVLGAALWCSVLAWLGDYAFRKQPDLLQDPEKLEHFIKSQSFMLVAGAFVFALLYFAAIAWASHAKRRNAA